MSPQNKMLDPQIAAYLEAASKEPHSHGLPIEELRKKLDSIGDFHPPEAVENIEDIDIQGPAGKVALRVYTPKSASPLPAVIFYHGGGWSIGSRKAYDNITSAVANRARAVVFSVEYRLAPENPFPAAFDDCYAALKYVSLNAGSFNADKGRLVVMGDSAGGNLASAVSLKALEEKSAKIALLVLIYPATNLARFDLESFRLFSKGYDLDAELIKKYKSYYLPDEKDWKNPYASPALAKDLKGFPPTLFISAECDPLRDDSVEFAGKLKKAGTRVTYSLYKGAIHGFVSFTTFDIAQRAIDEIAGAIKKYCKE